MVLFAVIGERIAHRIRHHHGAREVNDAFHAMRCDDALDQVLIRGIADEQRNAFGQERGKAGGRLSITTTLSPASASA